MIKCSLILQKTWCVAKPSADESALLENIDYACTHVDCGIFQKGCPCFYPDNPVNHASVAMNLYYQAKGRNWWNCDFKNSGLIVSTDPSKHHNPLQGLQPHHCKHQSSFFRSLTGIHSEVFLVLLWISRLRKLHLRVTGGEEDCYLSANSDVSCQQHKVV